MDEAEAARLWGSSSSTRSVDPPPPLGAARQLAAAEPGLADQLVGWACQGARRRRPAPRAAGGADAAGAAGAAADEARRGRVVGGGAAGLQCAAPLRDTGRAGARDVAVLEADADAPGGRLRAARRWRRARGREGGGAARAAATTAVDSAPSLCTHATRLALHAPRAAGRSRALHVGAGRRRPDAHRAPDGGALLLLGAEGRLLAHDDDDADLCG